MTGFRFVLCLCLTLCTTLLSSVGAHATPQRLELRDSALSPEAGSWSIGLFNPLKLQLSEDFGLELHPLAFLLHPHLRAQHRLLKSGPHELSALYGLSLPSQTLNLGLPFGATGYLAPSCLVSEVEPERGGCQRGGWGLSPLLGLSYGLRQGARVISVSVDVAAGLMLSGERPLPLDTLAPLEVIFAPLTNGLRVHSGARVAQRLLERLSASAELNLWWVSAPTLRLSERAKSPWTLSAHVGLDYTLGAHLSSTLGLIYWNSDQRAIAYEELDGGFQRKVNVRSHDIWPTLDLIWSY